jgi:hypothetical protein
MTSCDNCIFADWQRTSNGRLHPNKQGKCTRLEKHPLDMRIPPAFYWGWGSNYAPTPNGGQIERGEAHREKCVFKTGARP